MLSTASSPRWGSGKKRGQWGRGGRAAPQAVLLCCSAPSASRQALARLRPPAASPAGLEPPRRQRVVGGLPGGSPTQQKAAALRGCSGTESPISTDGLSAVLRVCRQPATSRGRFSGLIFLFFLLFKQRHGWMPTLSGKPQKEKSPPASLPATSPSEPSRRECPRHGSPLCHAQADVAWLPPPPRTAPCPGVPPAIPVGFLLPTLPPGPRVRGAPPRRRKEPGAGGGLHAPAGAARGAGARPNQRENLIKISDGAR